MNNLKFNIVEPRNNCGQEIKESAASLETSRPEVKAVLSITIVITQ